MSTSSASPVLTHIGHVRNACPSRKAMTVWGVPSAVDLLPEFGAGLLHLEKHSHVWILAWLDGVDRDVLRVVPRGLKPPPGQEPDPADFHGVFAVRSPARPNPIGLTAARITSITATRIEVDRLDFIDGTPVLDIKPYFPSRDCIFSASNLQVGRNANPEAVRESLLHQALAYCGGDSGELRLAVEILTHFRSEVLEFRDTGEWSIVVPATRHAVCDALVGMTHAMPGRGEIRFHSLEAILFEHAGSRYEYQLLPEGGFRFWPH